MYEFIINLLIHESCKNKIFGFMGQLPRVLHLHSSTFGHQEEVSPLFIQDSITLSLFLLLIFCLILLNLVQYYSIEGHIISNNSVKLLTFLLA